MRQDGEITYYAVQAKYRQQDKHSPHYRGWFYHIDGSECHTSKFKHPKNTGEDPTACGKIWQMYGYFGVTSKRAAIRWLHRAIAFHNKKLLKDYKTKKDQDYYRCDWRIVQVFKKQLTTPIMETFNWV